LVEKNKATVVLTTINSPNPKIGKWAEVSGNKVIVVGDNKTPRDWNHKDCDFISIGDQKKGAFKISKCLLENHYTRKNIGYLYALENNASMIIDTDDDNFPYLEKWSELLENKNGTLCLEDQRDLTYKNVYTHFSNSKNPFWPRGFPLNKLTLENSVITPEEVVPSVKNNMIGLWQCMVDGDPDIDAIHRLIFKNTPKFTHNHPILFGKNNLCSFNSQNTLWTDKSIFPLLYLPATVSFRFTDILRSYVAQIILNRSDIYFGFYPVTSYQERNEHNLMLDFESEISMYQQTEEIVSVLDNAVKSNCSINENLVNAYSSLEKIHVVDPLELKLIDYWLSDISKFTP
jgi:hypothetical protein